MDSSGVQSVLCSRSARGMFGVPRACQVEPLPNKRLKLPGALVGRIAFPRRPAFLSAAPPPCACVRCARSLSAIR